MAGKSNVSLEESALATTSQGQAPTTLRLAMVEHVPQLAAEVEALSAHSGSWVRGTRLLSQSSDESS